MSMESEQPGDGRTLSVSLNYFIPKNKSDLQMYLQVTIGKIPCSQRS